MSDIVDRDTRSRMMAAIRGRDTSTELRVRRFLHSKGLRFRLHSKNLPGKPDLVFPRFHTALFVHGCYWHRHPGCKFATTPKTNRRFWQEKFHKNVMRDKEVQGLLEDAGWRVLTIWECEIDPVMLVRLAERICKGLPQAGKIDKD